MRGGALTLTRSQPTSRRGSPGYPTSAPTGPQCRAPARHAYNRAVISIVLATYDRAATLPRAIDSVLRQTYADWELIIVDDGSRDETGELLSALRDPRIRVCRH